MMTQQANLNYQRIAEAIDYLRRHFREQPQLEDVARQVHLSPHHFQRLFTEWAGVSPKQFLQYISLGHAKKMLQREQATLFATAEETGLSGTGRLHDLFVKIEGMTPGEYKNGGEKLSINYQFADSPFGSILVASTDKGICHLAFVTDEAEALEELRRQFPKATLTEQTDDLQQSALRIFQRNWEQPEQIRLHLRGSDFQLKVWEALLKIPAGKLSTYGEIARTIQQPGSSRAVGSAIGHNPVAYLIPCHRVIRSSGEFGGYAWGAARKTAIIGWEAARAIGN